MRTIAAAAAVLLLASCATDEEPTARPTQTTAENPADPALCRHVSQHAEDLIGIVYDDDGTASGLDWIHAAEDILAVDEQLAADATTGLRDTVWDLVDSADALVEVAADPASENADLPVDDLANNLLDVGDTCDEAGYSLQ